jgi:dolichyl-phosphate-mannose-protein mannosyltransferase
MLLALAGWFVGFDGNFDFETIGDSYTAAHVPYVGIRALPATMGSLTVPIVYLIMKESGFPTGIAAFSACLILLGNLISVLLSITRVSELHHLDNAHITQTRLILLDAALVFFMAISLYSYIRFRKLRYWLVRVLLA